MKYSKYLIEGKFINMDVFDTDDKILKVPLRLLSIPVAITGIGVITGMLSMTLVVDEARRMKCRMIHFKRHGYKF